MPKEEYAIRITPFSGPLMTLSGTPLKYYVYKVKKPKDLNKKGIDSKGRMHIYSKKLSRTLAKFDGKFMGMVRVAGAYADDPELHSFQPISGIRALNPFFDHKPLKQLKGKHIPLLVREKILSHYYKNFIKDNDDFEIMHIYTMVPEMMKFNRENMGIEPNQYNEGYGWKYELSKRHILKALKKMRSRIEELGLAE